MRSVGLESHNPPRVQAGPGASNLQRAVATLLLAFNPASRLQVRSTSNAGAVLDHGMPQYHLANHHLSRVALGPRYPAAKKLRSSTVRMFGMSQGANFFGLGPSEAVVIGLAAYFLLGPKELFKLSKQAGNFLGEWRRIGLDAQKQFQDAMDAENIQNPINDLRGVYTEFQNAAYQSQNQWKPTFPSASVTKTTTPAPAVSKQKGESEISAPTDSEILESVRGTPLEDSFRADDTPDDVTQVKIRRKETTSSPNRAVMGAEEARLEVEIEQAMNSLETLRAEANILKLKRKQVEAEARRVMRETEIETQEEQLAQEAADTNLKVKIKTPE